MKLIMETWRKHLTEEVQDSKDVVKVVLVGENGTVLFLKRSNYMKEYAGEWDLPGGHVHEGEELLDGLRREVHEETGLTLKHAKKIKSVGNTHYYTAKAPSGSIKLSSEHTESKMRNVKSLESPSKYEKIAQESLK